MWAEKMEGGLVPDRSEPEQKERLHESGESRGWGGSQLSGVQNKKIDYVRAAKEGDGLDPR